MRKTPQVFTFSRLSILCAVLGHDYLITRKISEKINEYKCTLCNREVVDNPLGGLAKLTPVIKEENSDLVKNFSKSNSF